MESNQDMEKLIKRAMHGNTKAYGELIELNKAYLYKTAIIYVKNEEVALDVVQECVVKAFVSIKTLKKVEYFKTWITRILINEAQNYFRKHREVSAIDELEVVAEERGVTPEEKWDLYEAIDSLSEKYKTVVILKYFHEFKISEISTIMNIPEGSVKAYLSRAKDELREYLKEEYRYV